jgi:hypothetical protein
VVNAPMGAVGWHGLADGLGVPGSAAGVRPAYEEGTEYGDAERGSPRQHHRMISPPLLVLKCLTRKILMPLTRIIVATTLKR